MWTCPPASLCANAEISIAVSLFSLRPCLVWWKSVGVWKNLNYADSWNLYISQLLASRVSDWCCYAWLTAHFTSMHQAARSDLHWRSTSVWHVLGLISGPYLSPLRLGFKPPSLSAEMSMFSQCTIKLPSQLNILVKFSNLLAGFCSVSTADAPSKRKMIYRGRPNPDNTLFKKSHK